MRGEGNPLCRPFTVATLLWLCLWAPASLPAQNTISTVAGRSWAFSGGGGAANQAPIGPIGGMATAAGNIYVADPGNNMVFKLSATTLVILAGNGNPGYSGDGVAATSTTLDGPRGVAVDAAGNVYIADTQNHRVRKVDLSGMISTIAGTGVCGFGGDAGPGTAAQLCSPKALAVDTGSNVYVADAGNYRVRKIAAGGTITTVAGNRASGYAGDNGLATLAQLGLPSGLAVTNGDLYIADEANNRVRKVSGGTITTFVGDGTASCNGDGGAAVVAQVYSPRGLAFDAAGNLYIAAPPCSKLRMVNGSGVISTVAGTGVADYTGDGGPATTATMGLPSSVAADAAGDIYIGDEANYSLRKVDTTGKISTFGGNGAYRYGGDGGAATSARLNAPAKVARDSNGNLYVADQYNHRIRKIVPGGAITTIAGTGVYGFSGDGGAATLARLRYPAGVAVDATGIVYFSDTYNARVRKIDSSGNISTVAGGGANLPGDGLPATQAQLKLPAGLSFDAAGNLYIADAYDYRVRKVAPDGTITTAVGNGLSGFAGDSGPATAARLNGAWGVAADAAGNLFIADTLNQRIRRVIAGAITTVAGNGVHGYSGDGAAATLAQLGAPYGVALDAAGDLLIADTDNSVVRKVTTGGVISTVAGNGIGGFAGDNGPAASASLNGPSGLLIDPSGNLYIADTDNDRIRMVTAIGTLVDFSLAVTPSSQSVMAGNSAAYTVTITGSGGFTGPVYLSCSGLPSGASCSFLPNPAPPGSVTMTVTTGVNTPNATSTITVNGGSGTLARTATTGLTVTGAAPIICPPTANQWMMGVSGDWATPSNWMMGLPSDSQSVCIPYYGITVTIGPSTSASAATLTSAANLVVNGTLSLGGASQINNLDLSGTLTGGGAVTITGLVNWTNGYMSGSGSTGIAAGAVLQIGGAADKVLQRTLNNSGTVTWTAGRIWGNNGAAFNNLAGGVFEAQSEAQFFYNSCYGCGSAPVINNAGTIRKTATAGGSTELNIYVSNSALMNVLAGRLAVNGGIGGNGTVQATSPATLDLAAGNHAFSNGTIAGTGVVFSGGTMAGAVTISGTLTWTGGNFSSGGTTTIASGGLLKLTGPNDKILQSHTINNSGTLLWTGARIVGNYGGVLNNLAGGLFHIQNDVTFLYNACYGCGSAPVFNNQSGGVLRKTLATGTATFDAGAVLNNNGTVNIQSGVLNVGPGTSNGVFHAATGATINFTSYTHTLTAGASFAGPGFSRIAGGTLTVEGAATAQNFELASGSLTGSSTLTATRVFNWTGGNMSGSGSTNIAAGATFNLSGAADKELGGRTINNWGAAIWSAGRIWGNYGGVFNNLAGGTFDARSDAQFFYNACYGCGATPAFNNSGTVRKTATSGGSTEFTIVFNNTGLVDIQSGRLALTGGSIGNGTFQSPSGVNLDLSAGAHNLSGTIAGTGVVLSGGTLVGALTIAGTLNWVGGTMGGGGTTTIASGGVLSVSGANDKNLQQHTINNSGTILWTDAGRIVGNYGGVVNNLTGGVFQAQNDTTFIYNNCYGCGSAPVLNNTGGTFRKTVATGTTTFDGAPFNNNGTIDLQTGTLNLAGGGTSSGVFNAAANKTINFTASTHTLTTGASFTGAGFSRIAGGTVTVSGTATAQNFELASGTLNGDNAVGTNSTLTASGIFNWTGGTMSGTGSTDIAGGAAFNLSSANDRALSGRTINNSGNTTWTAGAIWGNYGGVVNNLAGGVFDAQSDSTFSFNNCYGCGSAPVFNNYGTLRKTATSGGSTTFSILVTSNGVMDIQAGRLALTANSAGSGTFQASASGTLDLAGGSHGFSSGTIAGVGVVFSGGTMAGTVTVAGTLTWTGGNFSSGGTTKIAASGVLKLTGDGDKPLQSHTINNSGTVIWTGARIWGNYGGVFNNLAGGVFNAQNDAVFLFNNCYGCGSAPVFNNNSGGTFRKTVAAGTTTFDGAPFNNSGTIDIQTGALNLAGGGGSNGVFNAAASTTINFTGSTHMLEAGASFTGAGFGRIAGGVVTVNGAATAQNFELASGTLDGAAKLTGTGVFNWTGGRMSGSGSTDIAVGAVFNLGGSPDKELGGRRVNNGGNAIWSAGRIWGNYGGLFYNLAGGTFDIRADQPFFFNNCYGCGNAPAFNNLGTLVKSAGTGTASFDSGTAFSNSGTIMVQSGLLQIAAGYTQTAGATILSGGNLSVPSVTIQGGSLSGAGTVTGNVTNAAAVSPGSSTGTLAISGNYTQMAAGTLNIELASATQYDVLQVSGTATLAGTLNIARLAGYVPVAGSNFPVMTYASRTGSFGAVNGTDTGGGQMFQVNYGSAVLSLTVASNPSPVLTSLAPSSGVAGGAGFMLTVNGSGFTSTSIVRWSGADRVTQFVDATTLTATITPADLAVAGTIPVTVYNPAPGGGSSGSLPFTVGFLAACAAAPGGLVSWWPAEGGGQDVLGANPVTLQGGASFATGQVGQAFSLNGATAYVSAPDSPSLRPASLTIEGWFKFNSVPSGPATLVGKTVGTGNSDSYVIWYQDGALHACVGTTAACPQIAFTLTPVAGVWYHVAFTFDQAGQALALYVNGARQASGTSTAGAISYDSHPLMIGAEWENEALAGWFPGQIDEVSLYGRALSDAEIAGIYNAGALGKCSSPYSADLSLTMSAAAAQQLGLNVTYTMTVTNSGPLAATAVTLSNPLPSGASFVSAAASQGSCTPGGTISCYLGTLAGGASATVTLVLRPTLSGALVNTASVTAAQFDANPANNSASAGTTMGGWVYLVGDAGPGAGDAVGGFGDGLLDNLDLIHALRAVTSVIGFRPEACSDRFDAMDAYPLDTETQRGGDAVLDNLDLIATLRRVTNADPSRPARGSRQLACGTAMPGMQPLARGRGPAQGRLELGPAQPGARALLIPVYLVAYGDLDLAALSYSVGLPGSAATVGWTAGEAPAPSLADHGVPGVAALAWLSPMSAPAGRRLLLGYLELPTDQAETAGALRFFGVVANRSADGAPVIIDAPGIGSLEPPREM